MRDGRSREYFRLTEDGEVYMNGKRATAAVSLELNFVVLGAISLNV